MKGAMNKCFERARIGMRAVHAMGGDGGGWDDDSDSSWSGRKGLGEKEEDEWL